jgi:hypothetical protein
MNLWYESWKAVNLYMCKDKTREGLKKTTKPFSHNSRHVDLDLNPAIQKTTEER